MIFKYTKDFLYKKSQSTKNSIILKESDGKEISCLTDIGLIKLSENEIGSTLKLYSNVDPIRDTQYEISSGEFYKVWNNSIKSGIKPNQRKYHTS